VMWQVSPVLICTVVALWHVKPVCVPFPSRIHVTCISLCYFVTCSLLLQCHPWYQSRDTNTLHKFVCRGFAVEGLVALTVPKRISSKVFWWLYGIVSVTGLVDVRLPHVKWMWNLCRCLPTIHLRIKTALFSETCCLGYWDSRQSPKT
jgi:hypothetical protein